jgi:hypothetical protein
MSIDAFSKEVQDALEYYVYRLIDPRDGSTFYIGKGKDDRIFAHVKGTIKPGNISEEEKEDGTDLKLAIIRAIKEAGLEVIHVIHRHGMDEETALEVEAALIDAYPGLTNKNGGHGSADRGSANVQQIENQYKAKQIQSFDGYKCVIIKIRQASVNNNDNNIYKTVRAEWRISEDRLKKLKAAEDHYVLAVVGGIVKGVYNKIEWFKDQDTGRYFFEANEAKDPDPSNPWLGCRIPSDFTKKGLANPVLLSW